jgi:hypothetical protein
LPLSSFIDLTRPENLHWLAILGGGVSASIISSFVPNYAETRIDKRSHNRTRVINETAARLHIVYATFLLFLITSDSFNGNPVDWLIPIIICVILILIASLMSSGRTMENIQGLKDKKSQKRHECENNSDGVCIKPLGWKLFRKVCSRNVVLAVLAGLFCVGVSANPSLIKHVQSPPVVNPLIQVYQKDVWEAFQITYKQIAQETVDEFEEDVLRLTEDQMKEADLDASYWFNYNGNIHLLSSTEDQPIRNIFPNDKSSIIGCGFAYSNNSVRWDDKSNHISIMPFNGDPPFEDKGCGFTKEPQRKIKSIACASYNSENTAEMTIGICIFTRSQGKIFVNQYNDFLKKKTEEFYFSVRPLLKDKILIPTSQ